MRRPAVLSVDEAMAVLDAAEVTLSRWAGEAADKSHEAEVLAAKLAEAESRSGDDLLDADEGDLDAVARIADVLLRLRTEQGVAVRAAEAASGRLAGARRGVLVARAGSVRARAARLREVATARQARTDQFVAELSAWEGVTFGPVTHQGNPLGVIGAVVTPRTLTEQAIMRAQWLTDHAAHLDRVAAQGADDQVLSAVNSPVPEAAVVESAVVDSVVSAAG